MGEDIDKTVAWIYKFYQRAGPSQVLETYSGSVEFEKTFIISRRGLDTIHDAKESPFLKSILFSDFLFSQYILGLVLNVLKLIVVNLEWNVIYLFYVQMHAQW